MPEARRAARRAAIALALSAAAPTLGAQERPAPPTVRGTDAELATLEPGTRVRLTLERVRDLRVAGRIDSVLADAFVLDTAERRGFLFLAPGPELLPEYRQMRVRFDEIGVTEVSRGQSHWRGAVRWGLLGAAVGGLITGLSGGSDYDPRAGDMLGAAVGGAVAGGLVGGAVGWVNGREIWERVR